MNSKKINILSLYHSLGKIPVYKRILKIPFRYGNGLKDLILTSPIEQINSIQELEFRV